MAENMIFVDEKGRIIPSEDVPKQIPTYTVKHGSVYVDKYGRECYKLDEFYNNKKILKSKIEKAKNERPLSSYREERPYNSLHRGIPNRYNKNREVYASDSKTTHSLFHRGIPNDKTHTF